MAVTSAMWTRHPVPGPLGYLPPTSWLNGGMPVPGTPRCMDAVIGVDAHKKTHTLVSVDPLGRKFGQTTVEATSEGHARAIRWVRERVGVDVVWGVEDTAAT